MPLKRKVAIGATVALRCRGARTRRRWLPAPSPQSPEITKTRPMATAAKKQISEKTEPAVDWTVKIEAEGRDCRPLAPDHPLRLHRRRRQGASSSTMPHPHPTLSRAKTASS